LDAHRLALTFGGLAGIRDLGAIEAAITRPYVGYDKTIERKAAALVESVASNHGFVDGNKRTALYLVTLLIERSGYHLNSLQGENINSSAEQLILDVVKHTLNKDQVAEWFRQRISRKP
jgi:death-on-curing protein